MAITARAAGTWAELTADGTVAIPVGAAAGDRMYLLASWKDFSVTAQVSGWTEVTEFADGAVSVGNGTGSMKVGVWWKDHSGSESDPTLDFSSSPNIGAAVIIVFQNAASETWNDLRFVTAAMTNWTTTSQTVTASTSPRIRTGDLIIGLIGIRDDSATMTRPTTGIAAGAITFTGNYVEYPATHLSTTTGFDMAADSGYRIASSSGTAAPTMTGTISAAETGAAIWILQNVSTPGYGQAQARIKAFGVTNYGQAQADIKATSRAYSQTQADILQTYRGHGQAQATITTGGGGTSYSSIVIADGPSAYWKFDEASGDFIDVIASLHAVPQGSVTRSVTGAGAGTTPGITLDGLSNSWLSVADDPAINLANGPFSIEIWFKRTRTLTTEFLLSKGNTTTDQGYRIQIAGADDTVRLADANNATIGRTSSGVSDTLWHHFVATKDGTVGSAATTIFLDGADVTAGRNSHTLTDLTTALAIGASSLNGSRFAGSLDDIAIYKSALTLTQVQNHFNNKDTTGGGGATTRRGHGQAQASIKQTSRGYGQAQARINAGGPLIWVQDTFTRADSQNLGTPDIGPAYELLSSNGLFETSGFNLGLSVFDTAIADTAFVRARLPIPAKYTDTTVEFTVPLAADTDTITISLLARTETLDFANSIYVTVSTDTNLATPGIEMGVFGVLDSDVVTLVEGGIYALRLRVDNGKASAKLWRKIDGEPDAWNLAFFNVSNTAGGNGVVVHWLTSNIINHDSILVIDNFSVTEVLNVHSGQAQARIKQIYTDKTGQAQARIKNTYFGLGQTQADIKRTYTDKTGQAQADIKQTSRGLGQAQADIKQIGNGLGQAQANIKATSRGLGQAQADIKNIATNYSTPYGQAQADIKQTSRGLGQAQATIIKSAFGLGQAQASIKQTSRGLGQAQADIKQTSRGLGQAQADIKQTYTLRLDYASRVIADGATSYWRFGEASGNPQDSVGTNHVTVTSGTPLYGQPSLITQDPNTSIFGDTASYLIPDNNALDLGDTFSIEFWLKQNTTGFEYILNKDGAYAVYIESGEINLYKPGIGDVAHTSNVGANGGIYHIVITKNGSDIHVYRNGADVTVIDNTFTMTDSANDLTIASVNGSLKLNGTLDEIAFYKNVVLTPGQVATHYTIGTKNGTSAQTQASIKAVSRAYGQAQADIKQTYPLCAGKKYSEVVLRDNPVAYYRLGEQSGTTATAVVGTNGTYQNNPTLGVTGAISGDWNTAVKFGNLGNFERMRVAAVDLTATDNFTLEAWVKLDSIATDMSIIGVGEGGNGYSLWIDNGYPRALANGSGIVDAGAYALTTGTWYHLVFRRASGVNTTWVNGNRYDPGTNNTGSVTTPLGGTQIAAYDGLFFTDGSIDEVALYNAALSDVQIQQHYVAGKNYQDAILETPGIKNYWRLGESSGTVATDIGVRHNNGDYSFASPTLGVTGALSGDGDKAISLNGSQLVSMNPGTALIGTVGTFEFWLKRGRTGATADTVIGGPTSSIMIRFHSDDVINLAKEDVGFIVASNIAISDTTNWHHYAVAWDGAGGGKIYIDGNDVTQFVGTQSPIAETRFILGANTGLSNNFVGAIDELALYDRVITVEEAKAHYLIGTAATCVGPFGQAQATIQVVAATTRRAHAQAQADIKATSNAYGQAQADIKNTYFGLGQAQADIKATRFILGQAQADIKQTSRGFGQAQADIKQVGRGLGQSQADIKQTYTDKTGQAQADIKATRFILGQAQADIKAVGYGLGQAQANIKATRFILGQAQADIKATSYGLGQAQADILQTSRSHGQAQAWIKVTNNGFGQAQADIKAVGYGLGQAQADIKVTSRVYGQAQADIKQTYYGLGQSQANIKAVGYGLGQAQANIKAVGYGLGQAQADIKATTNVFSQAQAQIKQTYFALGQAQADIKNTYNGYGQAQSDIKAVGQGYGQAQATIRGNAYGQAQADIKQTYYGLGQSQADIKTTYNGFGQAQADIKAVGNGYGQAQASIKTTYYGSGQSQADIKATSNGYGQTQADIKQTSNGYGQSQGDIKQTYVGLGQAQAWIEQTYNGHGQAQGDIKQTYYGLGQANADILQTYTDATGQAQAWIKKFEINVSAQAQAWIKTTYYAVGQAQAKMNAYGVQGYGQAQGNVRFDGNAVSGQAQAKINAFGYPQWGQAQADIKQTSRGYGQAQANIEQTYNQHAQAQGTILQTSNEYGQAQADIRQTYVVHGQAAAWIENTYNGYGQAQAQIKNTYYGSGQANAKINAFGVNAYGQAQAYINLTGSQVFGQAQGDIKAVGYGTGQAQADIKATSNGYGQAQGDIKTTNTVSGQAQAQIAKTAQVSGQAQAAIKRTTNSSGQANSDIKQTYTVSGQSAAWIKNTYTASGQANAKIILIQKGYGQAEAWIKQTYRGSGQAQAVILAAGRRHGQAQGWIKTTVNSYGQSASSIKHTYVANGQAQAVIQSGTMAHGQAQAYIFRPEAFGQAQALIATVHTLKNLEVSDDTVLSITLSDEAITTTLEDEEYTIEITDTVITVTVSDDRVWTLTIEDEAF